ncbi:MAG: hypothetical protein ABSD97_06250 [Acidimicrobiales bacterium]|jgi:hypothetical protein
MEHLPLDARGVVDELRSAPRASRSERPRTWVPSASFESLLADAELSPVLLNGHLTWLHDNCDLTQALAPPEGGGPKAFVRRLVHRAVLAVLRPYLLKVQDCVAETARALDAVARRVDDQAATQLRTIGALRADLVEFATRVDERLDE